MKKILAVFCIGFTFNVMANTKQMSCINYTVLKGETYNIPVSTGTDPLVVQLTPDAIIINGTPMYSNGIVNGFHTYSNSPMDANNLWLYRDEHHIGKFMMNGEEPEVKMYTCQ